MNMLGKWSTEVRDHYSERLESYRSRVKPLSSILFHIRSGDYSLKRKIRLIYLEIALVYNGLKSIVEEVRVYGDTIRDNYGTSKWTQFYQQCRLYFMIGTPWQHKIYRKYLMFDPLRWQKAREFTYFNEPLERDFIVSNTPDAIEYRHEFDIFRDKIQFHDHCVKHNVSTPPIYSVITIKGGELDTDDKIQLPEEDLFFKRVDGACGVGAKRLTYNEGVYKDANGNEYQRGDLNRIIEPSQHGSATYIVQPVIRNHESWRKFTSGALATCRILTAKLPESETVIPLSAVLRLPSGGAIADNFSQGAIGSAVDLNSGQLKKAIGFEPKNGTFETDIHPDTGHVITGTVLPEWDKLIEFTKEVHSTFEMIFVGWDISYTENGFMVVEGNGMWGADILECAHNKPLSATKYRELYNRYFGYSANQIGRVEAKPQVAFREFERI